MTPLGETPSNKLWVGNLAPDVTNVNMISLFQKYGQIDRVIIYSSRGFGFIYFENINDSKKAKQALQGSFFHGIPLRIKFAKPEEGPKFWEMGDGQYPNGSIGCPDPQLIPQDFVRNYSNPIYAGFTRQHPFQSQVGQRVGGQPTKVLCISYPPAVHVDEDMLHHAMILYGEIYNIKTFYNRNFSLVLFRSVEEAQCAKEGLQGKLFNDPRITIEYSSSDPAPDRDFLEYHPIPRWDVFDSSEIQRETKRSRIDGAYDSFYPHKRTSERGPVLDEQYGFGPFGSNVPSGPVAVSQANNNVIPVDARISPGKCHSGHDCWERQGTNKECTTG